MLGDPWRSADTPGRHNASWPKTTKSGAIRPSVRPLGQLLSITWEWRRTCIDPGRPGMRYRPMTRIPFIALNLFAGTALLLAQAQKAAPGVQDQDPSQPVARADSYGQPQQEQQEQQEQQQQPAQQPQPRRNERPPAAVPHYGLPAALTIKPGTFVTVRVDQELSSDRNQQGDVFNASLTQPIVVDGVVVAQRGQSVMGRVAEAVKAGRAAGTSHLALQLTGLTLADGTQANVQSQLVTRNGQTSVGRDVGAVATTTAVGAGIGAAADWGRGAAIGAGAGATAGIVGVLLTRGRPTVVYPETLLTFRVDTPVNVDLTRAPQAFRYVGPDEYDHPMQTTVARRPPSRPYYTPYPYYGGYPYGYGGYPYGYGGYYGYPYAYGPSFGIGIYGAGGRWGRRW